VDSSATPVDDQRMNIEFCVKLGKNATETYTLIQEVHGGDEVLPRTRV